jgi:hypothetical protein
VIFFFRLFLYSRNVRGYKKTAACYLLVLFRGQNIPTFVFIEEVQISNLPNPIIILTQHLKTASFVEHESHMGNCELGVPRSLNFQSQLGIKRTNFWKIRSREMTCI